MRVLVTYGTRAQATAEIAAIIGETLRRRGHQVDLADARDDHAVEPYDAVIVGGGLYAWRWVPSATRFVKRHVEELRARLVWFFSSGPLNASATQRELKPVWQVRRLARRVNALEHKTFGGRRLPNQQRALPVGDWRDHAQIERWAAHLADELERPGQHPRPSQRAIRPWGLAALCLFAGVTAIFGALTLVAAPDGSLVRVPLSLLQFTPFNDFIIPGVLLLSVGLLNLVAGLLVPSGWRAAIAFAGAGGAALLGWIVSEMLLTHTVTWSQLFYVAVAVALVAEASRVSRLTR